MSGTSARAALAAGARVLILGVFALGLVPGGCREHLGGTSFLWYSSGYRR